MTLHCTCKKCSATPAGKNRNSNSNNIPETMTTSYALKNGDVLIHWSKHDFDKLYSTEKAAYPGHTVVCGFFMLYPDGCVIPTETPIRVKTVIGGKATHAYKIDAAFMIETHRYTNQFQVYTRNAIPNGIMGTTPDIEAVVVMGCGNAIVFPSDQKSTLKNGLIVHNSTGFEVFQ